MASFVTDAGALGLVAGTISWGSDTIKARLVMSSVTPLPTSAVMTGLTAIGTDQTLGTKTGPTTDGTNHRTGYDAADSVWTSVSLGSTVGWVVVYKFVTNDADSIPIAVIDVTDTPTNGANITITYDATGVFYLQQ